MPRVAPAPPAIAVSTRAPLARRVETGDGAVDAAGLPLPAPDTRDALPGLSVVIACGNDELTAARAVKHAARAAARSSLEYEIVAVDDGSSDHTLEVIAGFVRPGGRVRVLLHGGRRGREAALHRGVGAATMPWVLLIDATDELDMSGFEDFLPLAPSHDLMIGWRIMRRGPVGIRAAAALWNALVRRELGISLRDVDCPMKLGRRDLLAKLALTSPGPMRAAELLAEACALGARVAEVGVRQRAEVAAPGGSGRSALPTPLRAARLALIRRRTARPSWHTRHYGPRSS